MTPSPDYAAVEESLGFAARWLYQRIVETALAEGRADIDVDTATIIPGAEPAIVGKHLDSLRHYAWLRVPETGIVRRCCVVHFQRYAKVAP